MKRLTLSMLLVAALLALLTARTSSAQDVLSEIRGGVLAHDVDLVSFNRESGADLNLELLFVSPSPLASIGAPRPHLGATLNLDGDTSQAYAGLTWEWDLPGDFFLDLGAGGAIHDGYTSTDDDDRKSLGSSVLFRLTGSLGYRLTERTNVSIMYDHISNAGLADPNEGLDNLGFRFGYRF